MTGADTGRLPTGPGTPSSVPLDYSSLLSKNADTKPVAPGTAGLPQVLDELAELGPPVSESGIQQGSAETAVKTSDPQLGQPDTSSLSPWAYQFSDALLSFMFATPTFQQKMGETLASSTPSESFETSLEFVRQGTAAYTEEEGATITEDLTTSLPTFSPPSDTAVNPLVLWYESMVQAGKEVPKEADAESLAIKEKLSSTDPKELAKVLFELADLKGVDLNADQKQMVEKELKSLAKTLANANAHGGASILDSSLPTLISPVLSQLMGYNANENLSWNDKAILAIAVIHIGAAIGDVNTSVNNVQGPPPQDYVDLSSSDPNQVASVLNKFVTSIPLPPNISTDDLSTFLSNLSDELIASGSIDTMLTTSDPKVIKDILLKNVQSMIAKGSISPEMKHVITQVIIPSLATNIAATSKQNALYQLTSPDANEVTDGMETLTSELPDDLSSVEKNITENYLQALCTALSLVASMRAKMTQEEGAYTSILSQSKLSNIHNQISVANDMYTKEMESIETTYKDQISQMEHAKTMKLLMPLISIVMAIIAVVVTVVCVVVTLFAGPAGVMAAMAAAVALNICITTFISASAPVIVGCVVAIVCAALAFAIALADSITQLATGDSMWTLLAKAMGVTSQGGVAGISLAFQAAIYAIMVAATLGAGLAIIASQAGMTLGKAAVNMATEATSMGLSKLLTSPIGSQIMTIGISVIFSSGVIMLAIQKLVKLMNLDDTESTVVTALLNFIILALLLVAVSGKGAAGMITKPIGAISKAATAVKEGTAMQSIVKTMQEGIKTLAKYANTTVNFTGQETLTQTIKAFANILAKAIETYLSKLAQSIKEASPLKDLKTYFTTMAQKEKDASSGVGATATTVASVAPSAGTSEMSVLATAGYVAKHLMKVLIQMARDGVLGGGGVGALLNALTTLRLALELSTAAYGIKSEQTHMNLQEQLADLQEEIAVISSHQSLMSGLKGVDETALINSIQDSASQNNDLWIQLCQLVTSFITNAGIRLSELTSRAG